MAGNTVAKKRDRLEQVLLEDVRLLFRNFAGKQGQYNPAGARNFCVVLPKHIAAQMEADGYNIRPGRPREEGDEPDPFVQVKVNMNSQNPPKIVTITSRGRTQLTEDVLMILDWADIEKADLIINPYQYHVQGRDGVTAYLQTLFVHIREDALEQKYADVPDTGQNGLGEGEKLLAIGSGSIHDEIVVDGWEEGDER